ncbi:MAG: hypothetical protein EZS28_044438 [Streblomastix strix]|uniref:Peptidase M16 C-terminal domain-containing protein n=1 Tax=Streblomastix strix TaxID=222440 RepID=A0A5J4TRQ0_9EUKA|nr:MAG: hypothetical protein EZS28_044438 [Streblomastix strix]
MEFVEFAGNEANMDIQILGNLEKASNIVNQSLPELVNEFILRGRRIREIRKLLMNQKMNEIIKQKTKDIHNKQREQINKQTKTVNNNVSPRAVIIPLNSADNALLICSHRYHSLSHQLDQSISSSQQQQQQSISQSDPFSSPCSRVFITNKLISKYFSSSEGPLFSIVRGKGAAYGASLQPDSKQGLMELTLNDCNNVALAYSLAREAVLGEGADLEKEKKLDKLSKTTLIRARSSFIFGLLQDEFTPLTALNSRGSNISRWGEYGNRNDFTQKLIADINSITEAELMHAYEEFVVPVFNADTQTITIVSPAAKVDETIREFKDQFGIELTKIESVDEL